MDDSTRKEVTRLLKRGLNHYGLGDLDAAISCWERAQALDPLNRAAHDYLETAYDEAGREPDKEDATPLSVAQASAAGPASDAMGDDDTPCTFDGAPPPLPAGGTLPDVPSGGAEEPNTIVAAALDAYKAGNLDAAWEKLQQVASNEPDRLDVQGYLVMVRSERARNFAREVGDQGRVLQLNQSMAEIMKMNLSPDEGFLLSQIDGQMSIEELLNMANDRVRTLEIVAKFLREGIVT